MFTLTNTTPKPWFISHTRNLIGAENKPIATTYQHGTDTETCLANVRLMAVAPDMFELLAKTLGELEHQLSVNEHVEEEFKLNATAKSHIVGRIATIRHLLTRAVTAQPLSEPAQQ